MCPVKFTGNVFIYFFWGGGMRTLQVAENVNCLYLSFQNFGNTCYLNSGLQAILSIPKLIDEAKNLLKNQDIRTFPVLERFCLLCQAISDNRPDRANRRIRDIKTFLGETKPIFSTNDMQDSEEFILELLDILEFSLGGLGVPNFVSNFFLIRSIESKQCYDDICRAKTERQNIQKTLR